MATKAIPVVAAKVAATLADYPAFIQPSAMTGWTTLTTAEANSIRFYSDSGLTTELARECVSADEIHVKVPSLTTTTTIYADYDGIRSDYAVTDTYGRNAVWTGYEVVYHLEGSSTDSAGNSDGTDANITYSSGNGKFGQGAGFNGTSSAIYTNRNLGANPTFTASTWFKSTSSSTTLLGVMSMVNAQSANNATQNYLYINGSNDLLRLEGGGVGINGTNDVVNGNWQQTHWVMENVGVNNANAVLYENGVSQGTGTYSATNFNHWARIGRLGNTAFWFPGEMDEYRIASSVLSADWITTEYNNQSNVGTFWGTVTDAGGGFTKPNFKGFSRL